MNCEPINIRNSFEKYKNVEPILIKDSVGNQNPKVSIVIPTYNRVSTLKETIESCMLQEGFDNYIIIICDNNSERNDDTERFITSYKSNKIKYYKNSENIGLFGNWNRVFELSESELTVIIHDDDLMYPDYLKVTVGIFDEDDSVDALYVTPYQWTATEGPCPKQSRYEQYHYTKLSYVDLFGNPFAPTGLMIKKSKVMELGGFDSELYPSSDYYFNVKAVEHMNVYFLKEKLYAYRWSINVYSKLETLLQYPKLDIPMWKYIASKLKLPQWMTNLMLYKKIGYFMQEIKLYHPEYNTADLETEIGYNRTLVMDVLGKGFIGMWLIYRKIVHLLNQKTYHLK